MTVPLYNLTDTWNNAGTVFTAIGMNVTNAASAAGSKLLDLQINGSSIFNFTKDGFNVNTSDGTFLGTPSAFTIAQSPSAGYAFVCGGYGNNAFAFTSVWKRTRGATHNANGILSNFDVLGELLFDGNDGTQFLDGAQITAFVSGTPATNVMPVGLRFRTNLTNTLTDALVIAPAGDVITAPLGANATNANSPFLYIGSTAGVPTGTPVTSGLYAGNVPIIFDTTDSRLYAFASSAWNNLTPLVFDAANITAQRNGTSAQTLRVANTWTDATHNEYGVLDWTTSANVLTIGTQTIGGTARFVNLVVGGSACIQLQTSGISVFQGNVNVNGQFLIGINVASFGTGSDDIGFSRSAAKVVRIGDGAANTNGWMQWAGQARVTTQFDKTNNTLGNVTGLTVNVQAGRTYESSATLYTTSNIAAGVQAAIAGTCTATAIIYEGETTAAAAVGAQTRATALATAVGAVTAVTAARIDIEGTITVNAAGTLTVQFAQNVTNAAASSVLVGSVFTVYDVA